MQGYGATPPIADWPNGAAVCVQFVVNYEEGGENCLLHGDSTSEAFLSEIVGAQPWEGQRHWNMESIYEYGARVGFWRLYRLFTGLGVPVTVYGVATALRRGPAQVAAANEEGDAEMNDEERAKRERQEQRLQTMTSYVVVMGLVEVCCRIKSL